MTLSTATTLRHAIIARRCFIVSAIIIALLSSSLSCIIIPRSDAATVDVTLVAGAVHGWPDGIGYDLLAYNGTVPGPEIHITVGDTLIIRLVNHLPNNQTTSLHLHGVIQYHNAAHDGVPGVSQCALVNGDTFVYVTTIVEKDQGAGTYWYHSHSGAQRGEGLYGALIVHPAEPSPYHAEHVMMITDWWHHPLSMIWQQYVWAIPAYVAEHHRREPKVNITQVDGGAFVLNGVLVNGRGFVNCSDAAFVGHTDCRSEYANYTVYRVRHAEQHLLRMVGTMMALELAISIDDHPYTIVATDGCPTQPVTANLLVVASGETYDIVFTANRSRTNPGTSTNGRYWIRGCEPYRCKRLAEWRTIAIIEYDDWYGDDADDYTNTHSDHQQQVWPDSQASQSPLYDFMDLKPLVQPPHFVPTHNLTITSKQEWELAGVQYEASSIPLSMLYEYDPSNTTDPVTARVYPFPLDSKVLVIINSLQKFTHAMHLHGHYFYLIGMGKYGDNYFNATRDWASLNFVNPVAKHSVNMQPHTWLALLIEMDNPGYWMFHCHLDFHNEVGMAMVFRDGGPGMWRTHEEEIEWHRLVTPHAASSRWCLPSKDDTTSSKEHWPVWIIATLGGTAALAVLLVIVCICTRSGRMCHQRNKSNPINGYHHQHDVMSGGRTTSGRSHHPMYGGYQQSATSEQGND